MDKKTLRNIAQLSSLANELTSSKQITGIYLTNERLQVQCKDVFLNDLPGTMLYEDFPDKDYPLLAYKIVEDIKFFHLIKSEDVME